MPLILDSRANAFVHLVSKGYKILYIKHCIDRGWLFLKGFPRHIQRLVSFIKASLLLVLIRVSAFFNLAVRGCRKLTAVARKIQLELEAVLKDNFIVLCILIYFLSKEVIFFLQNHGWQLKDLCSYSREQMVCA